MRPTVMKTKLRGVIEKTTLIPPAHQEEFMSNIQDVANDVDDEIITTESELQLEELDLNIEDIHDESDSGTKMASADDRQRGLIKNIFHRCSKKVAVSRPAYTEGTFSSQPATQSQPSPHIPTSTASSPQFYSPDPHLPSPNLTQTTPFYPYYLPPPYHGAHPPYPYPPYVPPPSQPATVPPQLTTAGPSYPAAAEQATEGRMLIEPDGDTQKDFYWLPQHNVKIRKNFKKHGLTSMRDIFTDIRKSGQRSLWIGEGVWAELSSAWGSLDYTRRRDQNRQNRASDVGGLGSSLHTGGSVPHTEHRRCLSTNICLLQKHVLGRELTPVELHSHTHKRQEDQQWIDKHARRAYAVVGEGSSAGSTDYSDYRTWSQAVGGMQHGRVYRLGSQTYAYEGQISSGRSFSSSTQESLYT
ncbi:hypothetical protein IEQ34_026471 [Dendrobium chrysotoxum]|uniref:Uncharacterized protein n=1 Tax=Dendrobium chrysotoxum TaxID=161865 RepID=A0AAV7FM46_DENCH|nr:hypothetical protein IEQ34_026471 [Dendrobium chrysotoxum]